MKRETLRDFVVANIKQKVDTDTIKRRVAGHLQHTAVEDLLELKHSGDLDDRADAIIRVVANKLYNERA